MKVYILILLVVFASSVIVQGKQFDEFRSSPAAMELVNQYLQEKLKNRRIAYSFVENKYRNQRRDAKKIHFQN